MAHVVGAILIKIHSAEIVSTTFLKLISTCIPIRKIKSIILFCGSYWYIFVETPAFLLFVHCFNLNHNIADRYLLTLHYSHLCSNQKELKKTS
jgi:hypothetical protein